MAISSITVLGGDLRQCYAAEYLAARGFPVTCFGTPDFPFHSFIKKPDTLSSALEQASFLLLPTPCSKDGIHLFQQNSKSTLIPLSELEQSLSRQHTLFFHNIPIDLQNQLSKKGCRLRSFSQKPEYLKENARLTGEGLLCDIIRLTPFSIKDTNLFLLGYGCCGKAIASVMSGLGAKLYILEQDPKKQQQAEHSGFLALAASEADTILPHCRLVINTIPDTVLSGPQISLLPGCCHIFDIASAPFGFPEDTTRTYLLPYYRLPGIPGKFCPQTAGINIGRTIERMMTHAL